MIDLFANTVLSTATSFDLRQLESIRHRVANRFGEGAYPNYGDIDNLFNFVQQYQTLGNHS